MFILLGLLCACGGDNHGGTEAGTGSSGSAGEATAGEATGTSSTGSGPTDATGSDGSGSEAGDPTGDEPTGGEPTGGGESHRVCDLYLNCLAVIAPTELPDAQQGFGPDGTCWQGDEGSAEQCIAACEGGLATWHEYDPGEPACWLCQAPTDCPEGQACEAGECSSANVPGCGNEVLDADEICDGNPGCDADCLGPAECSPWTRVGCAADEVCLFQFGSDPTCEPGDRGLPELGEVCDPNVSEVCAEGLVCLPKDFAGDCPAPGCCSAFCNVGGEEMCPGDGGCIPNFDNIKTPGLDYLGFCV